MGTKFDSKVVDSIGLNGFKSFDELTDDEQYELISLYYLEDPSFDIFFDARNEEELLDSISTISKHDIREQLNILLWNTYSGHVRRIYNKELEMTKKDWTDWMRETDGI